MELRLEIARGFKNEVKEVVVRSKKHSKELIMPHGLADVGEHDPPVLQKLIVHGQIVDAFIA